MVGFVSLGLVWGLLGVVGLGLVFVFFRRGLSFFLCRIYLRLVFVLVRVG